MGVPELAFLRLNVSVVTVGMCSVLQVVWPKPDERNHFNTDWWVNGALTHTHTHTHAHAQIGRAHGRCTDPVPGTMPGTA